MPSSQARSSGSGARRVPLAAREALEQALWRMVSFYDLPFADLEAASAAAPDWALPHAMRAGFLWSLTEPNLHVEAAQHLERARALLGPHSSRAEHLHVKALAALQLGRSGEAVKLWDAYLLEAPQDMLALHWAQSWDFYRGETVALRWRPARLLPDWPRDERFYPYVLAHQAFGLEENNLHASAEELARHALSLNPQVPWAVHAVAHVMEMQGRFDDGAAWLRQQQPHWAEGNGFACHLWWHGALFRLEALDVPGVLRVIDKHLSGEALQIGLQCLDAASLLWRLFLLGHDVSALARELLWRWPLRDSDAGDSAFNDVHALMALALAGDGKRAEHWIALCASRALDDAQAGHANQSVARDIGLPLMRGLLALARGDASAAGKCLQRPSLEWHRLGGSHAQRDVFAQSLLVSAASAGEHALARALLNERLCARPETPLWRQLAQGLPPAATLP
jgi:hypothetical protein